MENEGAIDHIFDVLNKYKHPFVLVGLVAHRWMGCASHVDEGFDIVLRNDQLNMIVADLIETGHWSLFDPHKKRQIFETDILQSIQESEEYDLVKHLCEADTVLRQFDLDGFQFEYLRIWSEETYQIKVDDCAFVEVPELNPMNNFLVEKEFHPAIDRTDGWWYGPRILDKEVTAENRYRIFSTVYKRAKGAQNPSSIFILSIPEYLDALVYHKTHYEISKPKLSFIASWQIRCLTRYLFLEVPHQKNSILFQVEAETENYMQPYLDRWKRRPILVMTDAKESMHVNVWDPESYPEEFRRKWISPA
jgi:hypothetical protein